MVRQRLEELAEQARDGVVQACAEKAGPQDAEDLAHEGFVRVWQGAASLKVGPGKDAPVLDAAGHPLRGGLEGEWMMRARKERERRARELGRQRGVDAVGLVVESPSGPGDPQGIVADAAGALHLWRSLSPLTQKIVGLRAQGATLPEICKAVGYGRWAVWQRITAAKNAAKTYIEEVSAVLLAPAAWFRRQARRPRRFLDERWPWSAARETGALGNLLVAGVAASVMATFATDSGVGASSHVPPPGSHASSTSGDRRPLLAAALSGDAATSTSPRRPPGAAEAGGPPAGQRASALAPLEELAEGRTAGSETPGDTQITTAAPAPDFARSHTIVAVGYGRTCQCSVLYESRDAGQSWTATAAAPGAEQVVLPPTYPRDARIFLGTAPGSGVPPYVVAGFDATPLPLPSPPGHLALSSAFDSGDDRIFVSTDGALWTVDARSMRGAPTLLYPAAAGIAQVATAVGDPQAAVYATIPSAPGSALTGAAKAGLYSCLTTTAACGLVNPSIPSTVTALSSTAIPGTPGALVAVWDGRIHVSRDGGNTFAGIESPPGGGGVGQVSLGGYELWAFVATTPPAPHPHIEVLDLTGSVWRRVNGSVPSLLQAGTALVVLMRGVVLDLLPRGVLCTADGGESWWASCPIGQVPP